MSSTSVTSRNRSRKPACGKALADHQFASCIDRTAGTETWESHTADGARWLIKVLFNVVGTDPKQIAAVKQLQELKHPTLQHAKYLPGSPGCLVAATKYPETTLLNCLKLNRATGERGIPRRDLLDWLWTAARCLDEVAWQHKLAHLGLSPRHLLLENGELQISEHGIAQLLWLPKNMLQGQISLRYAAPELQDRQQASPACDQFSLAVMYQELLTGTIPFRTRTHGTPDLSPLPEMDQKVIARALDFNEKKCFASCGELLDALENAESAMTVALAGGPEAGSHTAPDASRRVESSASADYDDDDDSMSITPRTGQPAVPSAKKETKIDGMQTQRAVTTPDIDILPEPADYQIPTAPPATAPVSARPAQPEAVRSPFDPDFHAEPADALNEGAASPFDDVFSEPVIAKDDPASALAPSEEPQPAPPTDHRRPEPTMSQQSFEMLCGPEAEEPVAPSELHQESTRQAAVHLEPEMVDLGREHKEMSAPSAAAPEPIDLPIECLDAGPKCDEIQLDRIDLPAESASVLEPNTLQDASAADFILNFDAAPTAEMDHELVDLNLEPVDASETEAPTDESIDDDCVEVGQIASDVAQLSDSDSIDLRGVVESLREYDEVGRSGSTPTPHMDHHGKGSDSTQGAHSDLWREAGSEGKSPFDDGPWGRKHDAGTPEDHDPFADDEDPRRQTPVVQPADDLADLLSPTQPTGAAPPVLPTRLLQESHADIAPPQEPVADEPVAEEADFTRTEQDLDAAAALPPAFEPDKTIPADMGAWQFAQQEAADPATEALSFTSMIDPDEIDETPAEAPQAVSPFDPNFVPQSDVAENPDDDWPFGGIAEPTNRGTSLDPLAMTPGREKASSTSPPSMPVEAPPAARMPAPAAQESAANRPFEMQLRTASLFQDSSAPAVAEVSDAPTMPSGRSLLRPLLARKREAESGAVGTPVKPGEKNTEEALEALVQAAIAAVPPNEPEKWSESPTEGFVLECCFPASLPPSGPPLNFERLRERWKAKIVSIDEDVALFEVTPQNRFWKRFLGQPTPLLIEIRWSRPRPPAVAIPGITMRVRMAKKTDKNGASNLREMGPVLTENLRTMLQGGSERRTEKRTLWVQPVAVTFMLSSGEKSGTVEGQSRDVSTAGMGLYLPRMLPGTQVSLRLTDPNAAPVTVVGKFVRVQRCGDGWYEVGVRFEK